NAPTDGSYFDRLGHSKLHANGQVLKALGLLGGKLRFPCRLYEPFDTVEKLPGFLDSLRWEKCWPQSHHIWGGAFAFSRSAKCTDAWRECLFSWLDANVDPQSGWWKKGVPHADRHQGLGGAAHILPIYQHLDRPLPAPEKILDSTLAMQLPSGRWLQTSDPNPMHYLELDALYVFAFAGSECPHYRRDDILSSARRFGEAARKFLTNHFDKILALHPHYILAAIGCLGLLHQILPDEWRDDRPWTDIFSDPRFMRTSEVEIF
ncbi:MAG: hypothetical protein JNM63_00545, partial [Spirochaetia bacterium]|nr:hypothetical protein [Spirochaetia bacterium]